MKKVAEPLDRYDAAWGVYNKWKGKNESYESFPFLEALLHDSQWDVIQGYRNKWVHSGLPLIAGEFRFKRKAIWQMKDDPEPPNYIMKRSLPDGRVSFDTISRVPDFKIEELLLTGTKAIKKLHSTAERFLDLWDLQALGAGEEWEVTEKGMRQRFDGAPGS